MNMRTFIRLAESLTTPPGFKSVEDMIEAVREDMRVHGISFESIHNPEGLDENDLVYQRAQHAIHEVRAAVQGGSIHVFRAIALRTLRDLRTHELGECWSLEDQRAVPYNGNMDRFFRFAGSVPADQIDWRETVVRQAIYDELEVVLRPAAPVTIIGIEQVEPGRTRSVESDLIGQTLRA